LLVFGRWLLVFGFRRGDVSDNHRAAAGQKAIRHSVVMSENEGCVARPFELPRPQLSAPVRSNHRDRNFHRPSVRIIATVSGTRPFDLPQPQFPGTRLFRSPRRQFPAPVRLPGRRGETIAQGAVHRDGCLHHYHQQADPGSMPRSNMEMRPADVGGRASPARRERTCGPPTNCMDPGYSSTTSPAGPGARCRRNLLRQTAFGLK